MPLCELTVQLSPPIAIEGGPAGTQMIFEVPSARVEGEWLRGSLKGVATADWLVVGPEGTGTLDVRATLESDDDAVIFAQYSRGPLCVSSTDHEVAFATVVQRGGAQWPGT